jgi:hypothetical protein
VWLAIFDMADIREGESHVDVSIDIKAVVHHEFLCKGQTEKRWYYLKVLNHLRENVRKEISQLWRKNSWFLHHDSALVHVSLLIRDFSLGKKEKVCRSEVR